MTDLENVSDKEEEPLLGQTSHVQPWLSHERHAEFLLQVLLLGRNLCERGRITITFLPPNPATLPQPLACLFQGVPHQVVPPDVDVEEKDVNLRGLMSRNFSYERPPGH